MFLSLEVQRELGGKDRQKQATELTLARDTLPTQTGVPETWCKDFPFVSQLQGARGGSEVATHSEDVRHRYYLL